jgi:hypothetical protein
VIQPSPAWPSPTRAPLAPHTPPMRPLLLSLSHLDFPRSNLSLPLPPLSPRGALGFGVEITGIWIPGGEFFPSPSLLSLPPSPFFFPCARPCGGAARPCPPLRGGPAPPLPRAAARPVPAPCAAARPARPCPCPCAAALAPAPARPALPLLPPSQWLGHRRSPGPRRGPRRGPLPQRGGSAPTRGPRPPARGVSAPA